MAKHQTLTVQPRIIVGKKLGALRRLGTIPGHIFGLGESVAVQFSGKVFDRMRELHQVGGVIDLHVEGQNAVETVMVRHIARRPSTGKVEHVDFFRVRMNEMTRAKVGLRLEGVSPVVKNDGAVLYFVHETVEVEALPDNLPESITIDAATLIALDTVIYGKDLQLPAQVKLLTSPDEILVKVQHSRTEAAASAAAPPPTEPAPTA